MPFERVGKIRQGARPDSLIVSVHSNKSSTTLTVHVGNDIAKDCGFKLGEKAEVLWGYDDDIGILMLSLPEEEGTGITWKDNPPCRITHATTRVPDWVLPFRATDAEIVSREKGELVMRLPKEDEIIKRAPLASSDIKRPKTGSDPKITVKAPAKTAPADDQPEHPDPTIENTFTRETKRTRPQRFQSRGRT